MNNICIPLYLGEMIMINSLHVYEKFHCQWL